MRLAKGGGAFDALSKAAGLHGRYGESLEQSGL